MSRASSRLGLDPITRITVQGVWRHWFARTCGLDINDFDASEILLDFVLENYDGTPDGPVPLPPGHYWTRDADGIGWTVNNADAGLELAFSILPPDQDQVDAWRKNQQLLCPKHLPRSPTHWIRAGEAQSNLREISVDGQEIFVHGEPEDIQVDTLVEDIWLQCQCGDRWFFPFRETILNFL